MAIGNKKRMKTGTALEMQLSTFLGVSAWMLFAYILYRTAKGLQFKHDEKERRIITDSWMSHFGAAKQEEVDGYAKDFGVKWNVGKPIPVAEKCEKSPRRVHIYKLGSFHCIFCNKINKTIC